jgi:hypothetical protein
MSYEQLLEKSKEVSTPKKLAAPERKMTPSSSTMDNGHQGNST